MKMGREGFARCPLVEGFTSRRFYIHRRRHLAAPPHAAATHDVSRPGYEHLRCRALSGLARVNVRCLRAGFGAEGRDPESGRRGSWAAARAYSGDGEPEEQG